MAPAMTCSSRFRAGEDKPSVPCLAAGGGASTSTVPSGQRTGCKQPVQAGGKPHLQRGVAQHLLQALLCDRVPLDDVLQQNVQHLGLLPCSSTGGMQHVQQPAA